MEHRLSFERNGEKLGSVLCKTELYDYSQYTK